MSATTVDLAPPEINFGGVPVGFAAPLWWGFGTEDDPEDLTGRAVQLLLWPGTPDQDAHTPTVDGPAGSVTWPVPALPDTTPYVLLISEGSGGPLIPRVRGQITPGVRRRA